MAASRPRPLPPRAANHIWAYDFVFDACANGQQIKSLAVVNEFTHECLAIDVAGSIRAYRVIDLRSSLINVDGAPAFLRSDNGPEFVSQSILKWLPENRIETALIALPRPIPPSAGRANDVLATAPSDRPRLMCTRRATGRR